MSPVELLRRQPFVQATDGTERKDDDSLKHSHGQQTDQFLSFLRSGSVHTSLWYSTLHAHTHGIDGITDGDVYHCRYRPY